MRKVLVLLIAFSLVLICGAFLSGRASCFGFLSPYNWHWPSFQTCQYAAAAEVPEGVKTPAAKTPAQQTPGGSDWRNPCNWPWPTCQRGCPK
ncbi:MAG: hypothetical protein M0Z81_07695 [Deltaproteobacteria bacterium]|jgi:hypothetical protein|nr:hypothetical protein [Deltaproteobacteria bacterium]